MKKIPTPYKKGDRFTTRMTRDLKIMAIESNYVMLRYSGCEPFIKTVKDLPAFLRFVKAEPLIDKALAEKLARIVIVNEIIKEISSHGRRFFHSKGNIAEIFLRNNKLYYKCEWVNIHHPVTEICLSIPDYRDLKGWYHGGTLKHLVKEFCQFIRHGNAGDITTQYSGLSCQHWAYPDDAVKAIRDKAIQLGYLRVEIQKAA